MLLLVVFVETKSPKFFDKQTPKEKGQPLFNGEQFGPTTSVTDDYSSPSFRPRPRGRVSNIHPGWFVTAGAVAAIIVVLVLVFSSYYATHSRVATICDKGSVASGNNGHQYRIYTSSGTFRLSDHILDGARFNTADEYGRLKVGKTYNFTYYGWRFGWTSSMPNITKAVLLPPSQQQPNACN